MYFYENGITFKTHNGTETMSIRTSPFRATSPMMIFGRVQNSQPREQYQTNFEFLKMVLNDTWMNISMSQRFLFHNLQFIIMMTLANIFLRQARITKDVTERKLKNHNTKASCTNKNDMEEKCWKPFSKLPEENQLTKRNLRKNKTKIWRNLKKYFSL